MGKRPSTPESRIFWRDQGGVRRAYLDARTWGGPRKEALKLPGETRATTDPAAAVELARIRVAELVAAQGRDREQAMEARRLGLDRGADLATFADEYLVVLAERGRSSTWVESVTTMLARACDFFERHQPQQEAGTRAWDQRGIRAGAPRPLNSISPTDVRSFMRWLQSPAIVPYEAARRQARAARGLPVPSAPMRKPYGQQSVRHHLFALSGLYREAESLGKVGMNPVAKLNDKPGVPKSTTKLLEPEELAILLESARTYRPDLRHGGRKPLTCLYELLATCILTGAREDEVCSLTIGDAHLGDELYIEIPGTKTEGSDRVVPAHQQLAEILQPYIRRRRRALSDAGVPLNAIDRALLFASERTGGPVTDWRKALDAVAVRAGFEAGAVRTRRFRTSYITHRLVQTNGDVERVRQEVGHETFNTISRTYARASRRKWRGRPGEFSFRVEDYADMLADRLRAIGELDRVDQAAAAAAHRRSA